jgi:heme exporter protein D
MTSEWIWVAAAYSLTWFVLGSYAILALRRRRNIEREVAAARMRNRRQLEVEP